MTENLITIVFVRKIVLLSVFLVIVVWLLGKQFLMKQGDGSIDNKIGVVYVPRGEKVVEANRVVGKVLEWNADKGEILVEVEQGNEQSFDIDPTSMTVFVPEAQAKTNRVLMIQSKEDKHWPTAFCIGDVVTIGIDKGKVVVIDNGGHRICGLRE